MRQSLGLWLEGVFKCILFLLVVQGDNHLPAILRNSAYKICITFCESKVWPECSLKRNGSIFSIGSKDGTEKDIFVQALSILILWFSCRTFPTSASPELAIPSNPTPIPLCFLWSWKRALVLLEKELSSCWWLCNPKIWLFDLFSPQINKLCLHCLEEGPWEWQKRLYLVLLLVCDWCKLSPWA